jgi:hypothetical protein
MHYDTLTYINQNRLGAAGATNSAMAAEGAKI